MTGPQRARPEDAVAAFLMLRDGVPYPEVPGRLGVTRNTLTRRMRENVALRDWLYETAAARVAAGTTVADALTALGIPVRLPYADERLAAMLHAARPRGSRLPHGTSGRFRSGCHCEPCRAAETAYQAAQRASRVARGLTPGDPRHGTSNGYMNWECRCPPCRAAGSVVNAEQRAKRAARLRS